ncbi:antitoxin Xre/MbcA/ParS toxin-binding domain-containing protein [Pedobacter sp. L105]|uniref:type II RES/Xre toxin-antitoxin system antitoxin n=1 Tax=Pedobacter sp. L105 TaxID=1641871 RepID=UPI00131E8D41|nr:antitoxin Xre/MbcA/ParS toxin-binding domain-containing protein [Pedobacter sp. L105]
MNIRPKLNLKDLDVGYSQSQQVFDFILAEPGVAYAAVKKESSSPEVMDLIREGIPKQAINNVLDKTSISKLQLARVLHISTRQMDRYEALDRLPAEQSNFLYEFGRIYTRALAILGDARTVDSWLTRPHIVLGEKVPLELMDTSEGIRTVDDLLIQIEFGFYS